MEKEILHYIKEAAEEAVTKEIEDKIVENPKTITMFDIEESPIDCKKIAKLTSEKFYNCFKDQTVILYLPVHGIYDIENFRENTKKGRFYGWGNGSIIFITDITESKCSVYIAPISRSPKINATVKHTDFWNRSQYEQDYVFTKVVIDNIFKSLSLSLFTKAKRQSKVFIVNAPSFKYSDGDFNALTFFGDLYNTFAKREEARTKLLNELKNYAEASCKHYDNIYNLRKGSTWNYIVFDSNRGPVSVVGYEKAIILNNDWELSFPHYVSCGDFSKPWYSSHSEIDCWKFSGTKYDKIKKMIEDGYNASKNIEKECDAIINKWLKKFVIGEPVEEKPEETEKQVEAAAKKDPDNSNSSKIGSEKMKLSKKAMAQAEEKVALWYENKRKVNIGACSDKKLQLYYQIAMDNGYTSILPQMRAEAKVRGLELKYEEQTNESIVDPAEAEEL